ncbi:MAG: tetratricopeptide repeat protein [Holosporaceae bacterium]|jgi:TolA-binding protein|nr:tetratricopeptide repeat protein [Holosporaceae bacterium]
MGKIFRFLPMGCLVVCILAASEFLWARHEATRDVDDLAESVRLLTGKVEELERKVSLMEESQQKKTEEEAIRKETAVVDDKKPEEVIKMAKDLIDENRSAEARRMLEAFVAKNPKSLFRGMALFYVGKSYFLEKDYQNAAIKYMESFEANPKGSKTDKALYQLSLCFRYLSESSKRKAILEKIISDYPGRFAEKAAKDLKKLKNAD